MKRCPACGNTYTNDGLTYCLEDGAKLVQASESQSGFDPEATLHISADEPILPTMAAGDRRAAPTIRTPQPPMTASSRTQPQTSVNQGAVAPSPVSRKSTSPVIVAGITAIVVLLLVIAGIGIALLLRRTSEGGNATPANGTPAPSMDSNRKAPDTGNGTRAADNSSNRPNTKDENRNDAPQADRGGGRAEAKVIRGAQLMGSDLEGLSREELRRLRNTVYARHGRTFDSPELQRYFNSRSWYKPRSDYDDSQLTKTDLANIDLIQATENSR